MRSKIAASIMVIGLGFAGFAGAAAPLVPGSTVFTSDGTLASSLGSFSILDSMSSAFVANNPTSFSGTLESWVLSGDTNNVLGGLDFVYRLTNNQSSNDAIHRLAVNGFSGVPLYAGFLTSGSTPTGMGSTGTGLDPTLVDRGIAPGDNAGFSFLSGTVSGLTFESLNPGETSRYLVLYTNATTYTHSMASVIDGSIASATTFAPIPEPGTYAMMLAGLGLMGFVARRRSRKDAA